MREDLAGIERDVCAMDYSILDEELAGTNGRVDPTIDGR